MDLPPMQVQVDPNEDTEWNDILRKHGIIPEKPPSPTPIIEEALREAIQRAHDNRLEDKDLDELDALQDEEDEDFLNQYRQKRMAEISALATASKFGQVLPLHKADWSRDVTEASKEAHVVVSMISSNTESRIATDLCRQLASKFGEIKFMEIVAQLAVEHYPEQNCPSILVYRNGDIQKQFITLKELNGVHTTVEDLEKALVDIGAIKENDHRVLHKKTSDEGFHRNNRLRGSKTVFHSKNVSPGTTVLAAGLDEKLMKWIAA